VSKNVRIHSGYFSKQNGVCEQRRLGSIDIGTWTQAV